MTTRLQLYNAALRILGESKLASLSENREPRRVLDDIYDDGFVDGVLEMGYWKFAARSVRIEYEPTITPDFGYRFAFEKPDDFIRVAMVCSDEYFNVPITKYIDEGGFWYSDLDRIYVQYISNGASYGSDLTIWPSSFNDYAAAALAYGACTRIDQSRITKTDLKKEVRDLLVEARAQDALKGPTKFLPPGQWTQSRVGSNRTRRDGGNRGGLIG